MGTFSYAQSITVYTSIVIILKIQILENVLKRKALPFFMLPLLLKQSYNCFRVSFASLYLLWACQLENLQELVEVMVVED